MGPRLKTFSLDDATMQIVKTKPNQSQWIRTLILQEDDLPRADLRARASSHWESLKFAAALIHDQLDKGHAPRSPTLDALGMTDEDYQIWLQERDRGHGVDFIIGQIRRAVVAEKAGGGLLAWQRPR